MQDRTRTHRGREYTVSAAHPAADLFPWLEGDELQDLADDIKANGLKHRIVRHKGAIVDGRNRELACLVAGLRPAYADLPASTPDDKVLSEVVSANLKRRHLSASQRAMIVAQFVSTSPGRPSKTGDSAGLKQTGNFAGLTQPAAAQVANVSERTVRAAVKVRDEAPELSGSVMSGDISVHAAARAAVLPELPAGLPPQSDILPHPSIDAGAKKPHPLYGKNKNRPRDLKEHRYGEILVAMRNLSRMLTIAMNAPDGVKLKNYLRFFGLVMDRGFIWMGKKYNAKFRGFQFRHAIKIATGKGPDLNKAELMKLCLAEWETYDDLADAVPE